MPFEFAFVLIIYLDCSPQGKLIRCYNNYNFINLKKYKRNINFLSTIIFSDVNDKLIQLIQLDNLIIITF